MHRNNSLPVTHAAYAWNTAQVWISSRNSRLVSVIQIVATAVQLCTSRGDQLLTNAARALSALGRRWPSLPASVGWLSQQGPHPCCHGAGLCSCGLPSCCSAARQGELPLAENWARPRAGLVTGQVSSRKLVEQAELISPALNCFWGKASEVEGFELTYAFHNLTCCFFPFSRFKSYLHFSEELFFFFF